eukprot:14066-Alexandrium_andersonii.AAC.1
MEAVAAQESGMATAWERFSCTSGWICLHGVRNFRAQPMACSTWSGSTYSSLRTRKPSSSFLETKAIAQRLGFPRGGSKRKPAKFAREQ